MTEDAEYEYKEIDGVIYRRRKTASTVAVAPTPPKVCSCRDVPSAGLFTRRNSKGCAVHG